MNTLRAIISLATWAAVPATTGETIDFEALACEGNRYVDIGSHYEEDGFMLDQAPNERWQFRVPCTGTIQYAGSTTLYNNTPDGLIRLARVDGGAFDITEIKIAELNGPGIVQVDFFGTKSNGGQLHHVILTDGRGPRGGRQTFVFPNTFSDLVEVKWRQVAPYHQFDDLVLSGGRACTYTVRKSRPQAAATSVHSAATPSGRKRPARMPAIAPRRSGPP